MNVLRYFTMVVAVLIAQLCAVSPSKADVQRGFCADWPDMPNTLKVEGYYGLFSGLVFHLDNNNIDWAKEMVDLAGAGSRKVTTLERLNTLLYVVLHKNDFHDEDMEGLLHSAGRIIQIEGTHRFPLYYILFYYSDDQRLVIVLRDVKFDEKDHISPGGRGCVQEIFSHVELYDFRRGSGDKDNNVHSAAEQKCESLEETKYKSIRCGAYINIIEEESSKGSHVFMRMPYLEKWQKVLVMRKDMNTASIFTEDNYGTMIEELPFNTVLITDDMKLILDKLH